MNFIIGTNWSIASYLRWFALWRILRSKLAPRTRAGFSPPPLQLSLVRPPHFLSIKFFDLSLSHQKISRCEKLITKVGKRPTGSLRGYQQHPVKEKAVFFFVYGNYILGPLVVDGQTNGPTVEGTLPLIEMLKAAWHASIKLLSLRKALTLVYYRRSLLQEGWNK